MHVTLTLSYLSKFLHLSYDGKKSANDVNNYRGITLSSILLKVFDKIIIKLHSNILNTSDMQYGFKKKHSTTQCTFVVEEIIQYYKNRNSNVYVLMLDASKAFDRVNYLKLFNILIGKGLCMLLVRTLLFMYINQLVSIKWGNSESSQFSVTNGVKQGGVLSPLLFTIYTDMLFEQLSHCELGCYVGTTFMGEFGYADDIVLLAPTLYALHHLYHKCKDYCDKYDIKLNPDKSNLLAYNSNVSGIYLDSVYIQCSAMEKHLGNLIGPNAGDKNMKCKLNEIYVHTNHIHNVFGKASYRVKYQLFKSYCLPLYGSVLWDYSHPSIEKLYLTWRKCVRKLINVPYNTHSALLPAICNDVPVDVQMHKRVVKFIFSLLESNNIRNKICLLLSVNGSCSSMCNTINYVCHKYNFNKINLININRKLVFHKLSNHVKPSNCVSVSLIRDLIHCKDTHDYSFLSKCEVDFALQTLCSK